MSRRRVILLPSPPMTTCEGWTTLKRKRRTLWHHGGRYVRLLISGLEVRAWIPSSRRPGYTGLPIHRYRRPARLKPARRGTTALNVLSLGFKLEFGSGGVRETDQWTTAVRLLLAVARLAEKDGGGFKHDAALHQALRLQHPEVVFDRGPTSLLK